MELGYEVADHKRILQTTSKRVRMIFSVMASPNRIDVLRILNSKGPLTYSELKSLAGFKSKKESGKFAYHLRKLLRQSLVALNKSERRYTITNIGKLVLSLARQIEERSIIENGKMYVRTSHESIEEFNSHKIIQSLVREGNLPLELAQKITEETENRIYKYQTTHLTGSLIREVVNSILLEYGHEEYRNKLARLGLPVFDVEEILSNVDNIDNGVEGLLINIGQKVLEENLLLNRLPKDVADSYLSGYLHIMNPGLWSLLPDTVFINIDEMIENGIINLGDKLLDITRIKPTKDTDNLSTLLSMVISLLSKETSQEIVIDDFVYLLTKYLKNTPNLEKKLINIFEASSISRYNKNIIISLRIKLHHGHDDIIKKIFTAYKTYVRITPIPKIGLVIDYEKRNMNDFSLLLAEIIMFGGQIIFSKKQISNKGIMKYGTASENDNLDSNSVKLQSLTINLPRLALESNKDETYFRARLALLMKPVISSMKLRKKDIIDLTRRGLNPMLASSTQYMQRSSTSLIINLIGLKEAVFNILGYNDKNGREVSYKVIKTAIDVATKNGSEIKENVGISMVESSGINRLVTLDGEKYGKGSIFKYIGGSYSDGITLTTTEINKLTSDSEIIVDCNKIFNELDGGLLIRLMIDKNETLHDIQKSIENASNMLVAFKPIKRVSICGNCGFKHKITTEKCISCNSHYIIT